MSAPRRPSPIRYTTPLVLNVGGFIPMSEAEAVDQARLGACPCSRGIVGPCRSFPALCQNAHLPEMLRGLAAVWRLVWKSLQAGEFELALETTES